MRASRIGHLGFAGAITLLAGGGVAGCSSDGNAGAGSAVTGAGGAVPGAGGAVTGAGGAVTGAGGAVTGAMTSAGGAAPAGVLSAVDAKITGTTAQCAGTVAKPLPSGISVPSCTIAGCRAAACLTSDLIGTVVSPVPDLSLLAECTDGASYCVPLDYIATTGSFQTKTCASVDGAEGRCISTCVPAVEKDIAFLPQDDCGVNERCAPCYEPRDGSDTKACRQGCDTGPTKPPVVFASCGSGAGQCVPQGLVPDDLKSVVPVADCTQPGHVCAPIPKVKDLSYQFPVCTPSSTILNGPTAMKAPNGQLGACVPKYLVDNFMPAPPMGILMQDTCQAGEICAPCYNPISQPANQATGACSGM